MPRRKKAQPVIAVKCDYCKSETETFVVNAEHLKFCINQYPGYPATKDCLNDYVNEKKKEKERLLSFKKEQLQKEEKTLINKNSALEKLEKLKQFLSKKKTNHPTKNRPTSPILP